MTLNELTIKKLDVPGPKARKILARDAATISPSWISLNFDKITGVRGSRIDYGIIIVEHKTEAR